MQVSFLSVQREVGERADKFNITHKADMCYRLIEEGSGGEEDGDGSAKKKRRTQAKITASTCFGGCPGNSNFIQVAFRFRYVPLQKVLKLQKLRPQHATIAIKHASCSQ